MIWVPFALDNLLQQWRVRKWPLVLAVFFIVISSLGGIFEFGYSKRYIHEAGHWLAVNAPMNARIYSNHYLVMYYSDHFGNDIFNKAVSFSDLKTISNGKWKQYDFLALEVDEKNLPQTEPIMEEMDRKPLAVFMNKRGDQVVIFRGGNK
jgi:hypothetical protein